MKTNTVRRLERLEQVENPARIAVHVLGSNRWTIDGQEYTEAEYTAITAGWRVIEAKPQEREK